jgi:Domain of unknown function (DUF6362)
VARSRWTPNRVADRLEEAADVLSPLPSPEGALRSIAETGRGGRHRLGPGAPPPEPIDRMDVARLDHPEDRRLVWLRAEGLPWKRITHRLGVGQTTAWQRWTAALPKISVRLNAEDEQTRLNTNAMNNVSVLC